MKILLTIMTMTLPVLTSFGQNWDKVLRQELLDALLNPSDSIFIEDRKQLEKITRLVCSDSMVSFNYTTETKEKIEIKIVKGHFAPSKHKLDLADTGYKHIHGEKRVDYLITKNLIDGKYGYGIDATIPKSEIKAFAIRWNGQKLTIPDSAFSNLYQPHLCLDHMAVEAYLTEDNKYLYVYLSGSDAAGAYSVKFVFDRKKYLTRIVGTNEMTDGFDFLDGTANLDD